jgi:cysteine desulfuration protein SufE
MALISSLEEIADNLEILGDWDTRYEYLMDLGKQLDELPDSDKTNATKVHGCMSNVWVVGDAQSDGTIIYRAECDTAVIRGVIAVLVAIYSGQPPQACLDLEADDVFERLGLFDHLSPTRHVGVYGIVMRMQQIATEIADANNASSQ